VVETLPQPQTIAAAGGRVAESLIGGFVGAPVLLLIVILNIVMIVTAGYFFIRQEELRNSVQRDIVTLLQACILDTAPQGRPSP
jgi:hypothetical protein